MELSFKLHKRKLRLDTPFAVVAQLIARADSKKLCIELDAKNETVKFQGSIRVIDGSQTGSRASNTVLFGYVTRQLLELVRFEVEPTPVNTTGSDGIKGTIISDPWFQGGVKTGCTKPNEAEQAVQVPKAELLPKQLRKTT